MGVVGHYNTPMGMKPIPLEKRKLTAISCAVCNKEVLKPNAWLKKVLRPTCSRQCNGKLRAQTLIARAYKHEGPRGPNPKLQGPNNPAWKGGVTHRKRRGNYVQVRYTRAPEWAKPMARADGYVMEHRLVMAQWCGHLLTRTECVHHADHNPLNNSRLNLELWPDNRSHKLWEHGRFVAGAVCRWFPEGLAPR